MIKLGFLIKKYWSFDIVQTPEEGCDPPCESDTPDLVKVDSSGELIDFRFIRRTDVG